MSRYRIKYKPGYKYLLAYDFSYRHKEFKRFHVSTKFIDMWNGVLYIKKHYAWDGASGAIDTPTFMPASLVHDALCQLIRMEKLPLDFLPIADKILHEVAIECGMSKFRAWYSYTTLCYLSKYVAIKPRTVLTAP